MPYGMKYRDYRNMSWREQSELRRNYVQEKINKHGYVPLSSGKILWNAAVIIFFLFFAYSFALNINRPELFPITVILLITHGVIWLYVTTTKTNFSQRYHLSHALLFWFLLCVSYLVFAATAILYAACYVAWRYVNKSKPVSA